MKKVFLWLTGIMLFFGLPQPSLAAKFIGGPSASLGASETANENVYAAGGNVDVSGHVNGDLYSAGGSLNISGPVARDADLAGGTIVISGDVGDDLRVAGGNVFINSKIGGELMAAGGQITLGSTASTTKGVYAVGGSIILKGTINGDVFAAGENVQVEGTITGNVNIQTTKLTIGNGTIIGGTLSYASPSETTIPGSARIGKVQYTQKEFKRNFHVERATAAGGVHVYRILSGLTLALVAYFVFKKGTTTLVLGALNKFWSKVLIGFVVLITLPIAGIVVSITVLGLPIAFITAMVYLLFSGLATVGGGILSGTLIFALFRKNKNPRFVVDWRTVAVGVIILRIVASIPVLGWLACFILFLAFFGEMWRLLFEGMKRIQ